MSDREFNAVATMVDRLLDLHPTTKAAFDGLLDGSDGFDYVVDAHRMLSEVMQIEQPRLTIAA